MTRDKRTWELFLFRGSAVLFSAAAVMASGQTNPSSDRPGGNPPQLLVRTHCNPGEQHAIASITWALGPGFSTRPGGSGEASPQIDLTTSRSGFDRGLYVRIWPTPSPAIAADAPGSAISSSHELDPARKVRPSGTVTLSSRGPGGSESTSIEVKNLEAGVNYYWRARVQIQDGWTTSQVAIVQAPACPVDVVRRSH
jgi:hypothetical protein